MLYIRTDGPIDGELITYPYNIANIRKDFPNVSFPRTIDENFDGSDVGVYRVFETDRPIPSADTKLVEEAPPLFNGSNWVQVWAERNKDADDVEVVKADLRLRVKSNREQTFLAGWTHEFSVGTHTLDLRNSDDKTNWTLLMIKAAGMVDAGYGAVPMQIRSSTNETFAIPATECKTAMQTFLAWGEDVLKRKWELDDLINNITPSSSNQDLSNIESELDIWPT